MLTNAQAALLAAASMPKDAHAISYGANPITVRAAEFKKWLDEQDAADAPPRPF